MGVFDNFEIVDEEIVNNKWIEWFHYGIPNEMGIWRNLAIISSLVFGHCRKCTSLDGCYFVERNMPDQPLHDNCDCSKIEKDINEVKFSIKADCDIRKFTEYIFKYNNGKKEIFTKWGYNINDSELLKQEFEKQAEKEYKQGNYKLKNLEKHGQCIAIKINLKGNIFYSGWLIYPEGLLKNTTPFGGWIK